MNFIKTLLIIQSLISVYTHNSIAKASSTYESLLDTETGLHYITNEHKNNKNNLLFVHGTPGSSTAYKDYLNDSNLNEKYNMISIDRLGFGDSLPKQAITSFKEHSKPILKLILKKFPNQKTSCIAHSYGSPLCLYMMSQNPDIFNDAILISGAYNFNRKILKWYNYLASNFLIKRILPLSLKNSNREMIKLKEELKQLFPKLKKIKSRIHLIHGNKDKIVPVNDSKWLYKNLSAKQQGKLILSKKDGHFILWKNQNLIKQSILNELQNK